MPNSHSWIIWPQEPVTSANDEFLAQGARIRITGALLRIQGKGLTEIQARKIADQYVKALRESLPGTMTLITHEHFKKMWPTVIQSTFSREDRIRVQRALRKARNSVLDSEDVTLRRCYDYIQTAHEDAKNCLFHLYKAIEAIKKRFGSEKNMIAKLKKGKEVMRVKSLANEAARDQRHSPAPTDLPAPPSGEDIQKAIEDTMAVLKAYADHIS